MTFDQSEDMRDAALWRAHVAKLDALVAYCPTCAASFIASKEMTRDEILFECGKTVGRNETRVLQANAKSVVAHWHEFGPEHGFDSTIDNLDRAISAAVKASA